MTADSDESKLAQVAPDLILYSALTYAADSTWTTGLRSSSRSSISFSKRSKVSLMTRSYQEAPTQYVARPTHMETDVELFKSSGSVDTGTLPQSGSDVASNTEATFTQSLQDCSANSTDEATICI